MLDKDPIAQRHMAKINKYRGEYDKWGNRLTRWRQPITTDQSDNNQSHFIHHV